MLTTTQRERIVSHLQRGWKLPDSLIQELWEAYVALEQAHIQASILPEAPKGQAHTPTGRSGVVDQRRQ